MKNILSIILIIGCLLTLFSCNNEPEPYYEDFLAGNSYLLHFERNDGGIALEAIAY